jgi:glutathione S-transferase
MIRLLEFHRSANCLKVRLALNYKGIPFEAEEMAAADRSPMLEAAGWPLVPVIVDGDVSMRESEAILHYLESNYRDRPSLTPDGADAIRQAESIMAEARARLRPVLRRIFGQAMKAPEQRDAKAMEGIEGEITRAIQPLEKELEGKSFLVGERMSLYDILLAAPVSVFRPRQDYAAQSPIWAFLAEHLSLPESFRNVNAWLDRVLAYDRQPTGAGA